MSNLAGKFLRYREGNTDKSWKIGHIYKVDTDGTTSFNKEFYTHRCDALTLQSCLHKFDEVGEDEWNKQENINIIPLLFN